ncbi:unnamed protein product [Linum tenue]|uniref:Uncharacterized protein n=1 Tax=Linum tenue TaxID=586396 RepID=A0AAV0Q150_9ROSI|nr:unnamed protein product [Linum tenue]
MKKNKRSRSYGLGSARKRHRKEDTIAACDRLSHLPEPIFHHILSFLDTPNQLFRPLYCPGCGDGLGKKSMCSICATISSKNTRILECS